MSKRVKNVTRIMPSQFRGCIKTPFEHEYYKKHKTIQNYILLKMNILYSELIYSMEAAYIAIMMN